MPAARRVDGWQTSLVALVCSRARCEGRGKATARIRHEQLRRCAEMCSHAVAEVSATFFLRFCRGAGSRAHEMLVGEACACTGYTPARVVLRGMAPSAAHTIMPRRALLRVCEPHPALTPPPRLKHVALFGRSLQDPLALPGAVRRRPLASSAKRAERLLDRTAQMALLCRVWSLWSLMRSCSCWSWLLYW